MAGSLTKTTILANLTAGSQPLSLIDGDLDPLFAAIVSLNTFGNYYTDTGSASAIAVTVNSPQTFSLAAGLILQIKVAAANTGATTLAINGGATKNVLLPSGGALPANVLLTNGVYNFVYDGTSYYLLGGAIQPRNFIAGLAMSTAGSSTTLTVAAGMAADSTNAALMILSASIGKTTGSWAVGSGNGGLDTGSISSSTWYHFYLIQRTDTGVTDVLFSTSASSPTMPASYTLKRRIGSAKTDGSSNWTKFFQDGDLFVWDVPTADISANNPGTSAVSRTMNVPLAVRVRGIFLPAIQSASTAVSYGLLSDLSVTDTTPAAGLSNFAGGSTAVGTFYSACEVEVMTNTSQQIRSRQSQSDANLTVTIGTKGWFDSRGKDA